MAHMDVFKASAFDMIEMSKAIEKMDTLPSMLGSVVPFEVKPIRTKKFSIEQKDDTLSLVPFSERGAAPTQNDRYTRKILDFTVPRIALQDTVWAHEVSGLREFGTESELMSVQREVADRLAKMKQKVEYTEEYLRLAAVQGKVLDPGTGAVYTNFYTDFNIAEPAAIDFNLDVGTTNVKQKCEELVISVQRQAKGAWIYGRTRMHAIVGDAFWFALTAHANVEKFYQNYAAMAILKDLDPSQTFDFGNIVFHRYIGSDDNTEIAVATDEAKFFPVGADGVFIKAQAPADEWMAFVNTPGQSVYAIQRLDREFDSPRFAAYHVHAYPFYACARPELLRKGTRT